MCGPSCASGTWPPPVCSFRAGLGVAPLLPAKCWTRSWEGVALCGDGGPVSQMANSNSGRQTIDASCSFVHGSHSVCGQVGLQFRWSPCWVWLRGETKLWMLERTLKSASLAHSSPWERFALEEWGRSQEGQNHFACEHQVRWIGRRGRTGSR